MLSTALVLLDPSADWLWVAGACNLGALGAFMACHRDMRGAQRLTAAAIVVVFLLNYPLQALVVDRMYNSESFQSLWREFSLLRLDGSLVSRADVFYRITAIFALVCFSLIVYARFSPGVSPARPPANRTEQTGQGGQALAVIFGGGLFVAAIGLVIQFTSGVGSLTAENVFEGRLDGVLYHTLATLTPLLFMAVHWEALRQAHTGIARASLAAYVALAVAEMTMLSSRGFIVLQMLPLVLLYLWMGVSTRRMLAIGLATVSITVIMYPVMTSVRSLRANSGYDAVDSIAAAFSANTERHDTFSDVARMTARFIGYTSYLTSLERPDDRFDWSLLDLEKIVTLRENGFTRWFTEQVAGYGSGIRRHFSSPGLLGAAQVIGGPVCVVLLPPLFALLIMLGIKALDRRAWRLGPLVPVNALASLLFLLEEGVFDLIFTRLVLITAALLMLSWLFKLTIPDQSRTASFAQGAS